MNISFPSQPLNFCYGVFTDGGDVPLFWNTSTHVYETYNASHWALYVVSASEVSNGLYVLVFPSQIISGNVFAYLQLGGSPLNTDLKIAGGTIDNNISAIKAKTDLIGTNGADSPEFLQNATNIDAILQKVNTQVSINPGVYIEPVITSGVM